MQRSYGELEAALLAAEERVAVLCSENERLKAQVRHLEVLQPSRPSVHSTQLQQLPLPTAVPCRAYMIVFAGSISIHPSRACSLHVAHVHVKASRRAAHRANEA